VLLDAVSSLLHRNHSIRAAARVVPILRPKTRHGRSTALARAFLKSLFGGPTDFEGQARAASTRIGTPNELQRLA
jgi:hypothetical protein